MQQIAVGRVQFDEIKTHSCCAFCSPAKVLDEHCDASLVKCLRDRVAFGIGNCRGGYDGPGVFTRTEWFPPFPWALAGRLAASMRQLDAKLGSRCRHPSGGVQCTLCSCSVGVGIKTKAAVTDAATAFDICHLDSHHACP